MFFGRQTPPGMVPVDLNQTIQEGLSFIQPRMASQRIRLVQRLDPDLPRVIADPGQILQVLVNLMVNAIPGDARRRRPHGRHATGDGSAALLIVEDTGIGMSEEILKQIFVPFFTTKDVGQGTGLGLSVVHGIVTAHGGTISVSSEPGQGIQVRGAASGRRREP